jgi:hypothetical protein
MKIYKCKKHCGFGFWFGIQKTQRGIILSFYLPFFVFALICEKK